MLLKKRLLISLKVPGIYIHDSSSSLKKQEEKKIFITQEIRIMEEVCENE